jgi:GT2 family glycosyltransferase
MTKRIAVLITCHNRKQKTIQCLEALYNNKLSTEFSLDVFLVDDASKDGTSREVAAKFPLVKILNGNGYLYWCRGMHLAWETASSYYIYDYYLWLNDDTILYPYAIHELLLAYGKVLAMSIICGSIHSKDGNFTYGLSQINGEPIMPNNKNLKGTFVNGNCVLISKKVYHLVGNLDACFPHAIGDFDYGLRAKKKGVHLLTTAKFIGICEKNERFPLWCYRNTPFTQRLKSLYSPLGNAHPKYFFIYERRHFGIVKALIHFILIHCRLFFPFLWKT